MRERGDRGVRKKGKEKEESGTGRRKGREDEVKQMKK